MMRKPDQASRRRGASGWAVVAAMVLLGLIAGSVTYWYWSMQAEHWAATQAPGAGSRAFDEQQMREELEMVSEMFTRAVEDDGPYDDVLRAARRLVEQYPGAVDCRNLLAQIHIKRFETDEAYEQLRRSLDLDPRQTEVHVLAGSLAEQLRDYDRAAQHYDQAASLDPTSARHKLFLAHAHLNRGEPDRAMTTVLEVIRADSTNARAYALLSRIFEQQGKLTQAIDQIDRALTHARKDAPHERVIYTLSKSRLLRRENRPEDALLLLGQLHSTEKASQPVLTELALCYAMLGQPDRAAALYEGMMALLPMDWEMAAEAARWRIKAGDTAKAREHVATIRRLNPRAPALAELEGQLR